MTRSFLPLTRICLFFGLLLFFRVVAQAEPVLLRNVRIFNGVDAVLSSGNILVVDGIIRRISADPIAPPAGATVIDGGNRVLTPGFIDVHTHLALQSPIEETNYHTSVAGAYAAKVARFYLESGFTSVRDAGGAHPDFARTVNAGHFAGPRIFPAGPTISQTGGHGDSRLRQEGHPLLSAGAGNAYTRHEESVLVDGVDPVLAAVRENLRLGSTQIKIMGGGGVMSEFDPIHTLQFTPEEIRAAVQAASDWGTYVMAHAYTAESIRRLVENGVRSIEHGLLIDEPTAQLVAEKGAVISTQVMVFRTLQDLPGISETNLEKLRLVLAGQENLIRLIKKYNILTGFGTDFVYGDYLRLCQEFTVRSRYWTPAEILRQATSEGGRIIRMAGKINRYGNFGEIQEGWVADLLLINGEPLQDITILEHPEKALALIMKDGVIVKRSEALRP